MSAHKTYLIKLQFIRYFGAVASAMTCTLHCRNIVIPKHVKNMVSIVLKVLMIVLVPYISVKKKKNVTNKDKNHKNTPVYKSSTKMTVFRSKNPHVVVGRYVFVSKTFKLNFKRRLHTAMMQVHINTNALKESFALCDKFSK